MESIEMIKMDEAGRREKDQKGGEKREERAKSGNRICSFNKIRMLRKNTSQRRFNTAGARIVMTHKLPFDFFRPAEGKESSLWERTNKIDSAEFTFYRSSSQDKKPLRLHLQKQHKEYGTKLPPVSFKVNKENIFDQKVKKTTKVSSRWLQEKAFCKIQAQIHPQFCTNTSFK